MSVFTPRELAYLQGERRLARIATVGNDNTPHGGIRLEKTKKYRDVQATGRAAIVIDDLASTDPWRPRGIEVRGRADALESALIRIHPERIVSWGIESRAIGERHSRAVR